MKNLSIFLKKKFNLLQVKLISIAYEVLTGSTEKEGEGKEKEICCEKSHKAPAIK